MNGLVPFGRLALSHRSIDSFVFASGVRFVTRMLVTIGCLSVLTGTDSANAQSLIFDDVATFGQKFDDFRGPRPNLTPPPPAPVDWNARPQSLLFPDVGKQERARKAAMPWETPTPKPSIPGRFNSPTERFSTPAERNPLPVMMETRASRPAGEVLRFPALNFEFTDPGGSWFQQPKLASINPNIAFVMANDVGPMAFMVAVEELGTELRFKLSDLVEATKNRYRVTLRDARFDSGRNYKVANIDGRLFEATGMMSGGREALPICYLTWIGIHNGVSYQLIVFGHPRDHEALVRTFDELQDRFRLIDSLRVVRQGSEFPAILAADRWGMKLVCDGTEWIPQKPLMKEFGEHTLIAARLASDGYLQTKAYSLFGQRVHRDAVVVSALAAFGVNLDDVRLSAQSVTLGKHSGVKVQCKLREGFLDDVIVLVSDDCVWGTVVSLPASDSMRQQRVDDVLRRLEFTTPTKRLALNDLTPKERGRHAVLFMSIASHCLKLKQAEQVREFAQMAVSLEPHSLQVTEAGIDLLIAARDQAGALKVFESAPREIFLEPNRQAQYAWLLGLEGRTDEAIKEYDRVFPKEVADESFLENYLSLLANANQVEKALKVAEASLARHPSLKIVMAQSALLGLAGRHDEAVAVLKKQRDAAPLAVPELTFALAETLLEANRLEEALVEVQSLIDSGLDGSQTQILKGVAELRLERLADSRRTFESILQKDKNNATAQKLLDVVAAKLGQGDFQEVRDRIELVPLPGSLANFTATKPPLREGDGAWTALSARSIHFQPGKEFRATVTSVVHILDRHGVEAHNSLKFLFSPLKEQVFVNRVEVFDEKGQQIGSVKLEDSYVQSYQDNGLATSKKVLNVPVPGLRPGCRLEYQVTYRDRAAPKRFPFTQHDSSNQTPTARTFLFVTGDISSIHWSGPAPVKAGNGLVWDNTQPGREVPEAYQDDTHISPTLVSLGDRQVSWDTESRDYLTELKSRLIADPQISQIVAERLRNKPQATVEEKINLLAAWVQQQLTYQGIEFGRRGQIMPPVEQTLRNRFGDCKDHSLLLVQLLRAAGIPAHLALADTASPVITNVPSMDQFDHMVVYVEDDRGPRVIDCTDKSSDLSLRVPFTLAMSQVLVLDANKPQFFQIPEVPKEQSRLYMDRTVRVEDSGTVIVSEKLSAYGYAAAGYRVVLSDARADSRREIIQAILLPRGANASLLDTQLDNLNDMSKPLVIHAKYALHDQLHSISGQLIGRLPSYFESNMFDLNVPAERVTPFRLRVQRDVTVRTRVTLPPGYQLSPLPADISKVRPFAELVRITTQKDGVIETRSRVRRPPGRFEPADWKTLHEAQTEARELFNPKAQIGRPSVQQVNGDNSIRPSAAPR